MQKEEYLDRNSLLDKLNKIEDLVVYEINKPYTQDFEYNTGRRNLALEILQIVREQKQEDIEIYE